VDKMVIKIPVFEKSGEVNRCIKPSFKPSLGCSLQPTTHPSCADPMHSVVTFCSTYSPLRVSEFKLFQSYSFK